MIAAKLRGLEVEITGLEADASPADIKGQGILHFRTLLREAVQASDPAVLSDKLRRAYTGIVLRFRHE